ncbi:Transcription repressor [Forsythia ovata]|uniref:Transcription repressor n=1 Tax=Forsythia ovata TaxID=205694 RepID=A0ABD1PJR7_9LAMI
MSNILWKSFNLCFARFKCLSTITFSPPDEEEYENPKNPSALIKNFNSLYDHHLNDSDTDYIPDFASVLASQRFFFSSPGSSNAIIEPPEPPPRQGVVTGGVAIQTYSLNPFAEFRKSMQEMIEAHMERSNRRGIPSRALITKVLARPEFDFSPRSESFALELVWTGLMPPLAGGYSIYIQTDLSISNEDHIGGNTRLGR